MAAKVESPEIIARNIKEWNIPVPDKKYKVVVHCSTYNHERYIEDTLNGFVMQKTDFPFCAIIIDDCSTDDTADIIRRYAAEYPDIIKPICLGYNHMQHGLSRNPYFDCWHESAEYIAQCEGDDYWIDPLKLHKQVDVLDHDEEIMLCASNGFVLWEKAVNPPTYFNNIIESRELTSHEVLNYWMLPTNSILYRYNVQKEYPTWHRPLPFGDVPLIFTALNLGKIYCLSDVTCVYRKLYGGSIVANKIRKTGNLPHQLAIRTCYEEFDKYSEGKYHDIIAEKLKSINNKIHFLELKKKSKVMAAIMHPQITWRLVTNLLYLKYKRKYQIINKSIG